MKTIREFFYRVRLKAQKQRALFELMSDIRYMEQFKKDMIDYDEGKARRRMVELKKIENRTPVQDAELDVVLNVISESKAIKNEFAKTGQLIEDVKNYLTMLG